MFKNNIWAADLTGMGSLSSKKQGVKYFLQVIGVFTNHAWIKFLKDKKTKTDLNGFIEIVSKSKGKPNKLNPMQSPIQKWLDDNDILMYSKYNEGKSVAAENSIKTLKGKTY